MILGKTGQVVEKDRIRKKDIKYITEMKAIIEQERKFEILENSCINIVDDLIETSNGKKQIMEYLNVCQETYLDKPEEMPEKTVETMQSALEYMDNMYMSYNTFFIKVCIAKRIYKTANEFITFCMQNPGLTLQDKKNLQELRGIVREAIKRERVIEMLHLNRSVAEIMMETGEREAEIIRMKTNMENTKSTTENKNNPQKTSYHP